MDGPTDLELHAAWILTAAFVVSLAYEVWRAAKGATPHDSPRILFTQGIVLYGAAGVVIGLLFGGVSFAAEMALGFCVLLIGVSIFYYNPRIMVERDPGPIDWFEDLTYTGLLFVAAALLVYAVVGGSLQFALSTGVASPVCPPGAVG